MTCTSCVGFLALCLLSSCTPPLSAYVANKRSAYVANKRSAPTELLSGFKLTEITKETTLNGFQFKLHLEGSEMPQVIMIDEDVTSKEILAVGPDGVAQFNSGNKSFVFITFVHPRGSHFLMVRTDEHTSSLQLFPDMRVFVQGGSQIPYTEGEDVDLNVSCTTGHVHNVSVDKNIDVFMSSKSESEEKKIIQHYVGGYSPYMTSDGADSDNLSVAHIHINTSVHAQGLLGMSVSYEFNCGSHCLVNRYTMYKELPIYRKDQGGPFPENFIGNVYEYSEYNASEQFCSLRYRTACQIYCNLAGDHPSPVEIFRVQPSGQLTPVNDISIAFGTFRTIGLFRVLNYTAADSGDYQCKSRSGQEEFTQTVRLIIGYQALIEHSLTTVNISQQGSVVATCGAEGDPAPTVVIKDNTGQPISEDRSDVQVTVTQLNDTMTLAEIHITDPSVASSLGYLTCEAENTIQGRLFTYSRNLYIVQDYDIALQR